MRVVATAGHVDHGKSTLVLALTGTDPDRFPEEKARGLTIDLGFAFCTLPSGQEVGFVDVPGHARFVKNMLAGVGAVDVAMLVVAANEGWKPQSEEHLRILDLLDVAPRCGRPHQGRHGRRRDARARTARGGRAARRHQPRGPRDRHVRRAQRAWARRTCARRSTRAIAAAPGARDDDRPRLWIDRVFAAKGAGTVVTGTLDRGRRSRSTTRSSPAVVRCGSGRSSSTAPRRTASDPARGSRSTSPGSTTPTSRAATPWCGRASGSTVDVVDGALTLLPGATIRRRSRLTAAVGSGEHHVWCRPLDGGFARLHFDAPVCRGARRPDRAARSGLGHHRRRRRGARRGPDSGRAADAPARLALGPGARVLAAGWIPVAGLDARTGRPPGAARDAPARPRAARLVGDWIVDARRRGRRVAPRCAPRSPPTTGTDPSRSGCRSATRPRATGLDAAQRRGARRDATTSSPSCRAASARTAPCRRPRRAPTRAARSSTRCAPRRSRRRRRRTSRSRARWPARARSWRWAGSTSPPEALAAARDRVIAALRDAGLAHDRRRAGRARLDPQVRGPDHEPPRRHRRDPPARRRPHPRAAVGPRRDRAG